MIITAWMPAVPQVAPRRSLRPRRIHHADEAQQRHRRLGIVPVVAPVLRATARTRSPAAAISRSTDRTCSRILVGQRGFTAEPHGAIALASTSSTAPFEYATRRRRRDRAASSSRRSEVKGISCAARGCLR